jgi:hypothetical protein
MHNTLILASFIFPERLDIYLDYLKKRFGIYRDSVMIFNNIDDPLKIITTFKVVLKDGKRINFKRDLPTTIRIHKRGNCLYTINALNKIIERDFNLTPGNINYKSYAIDWDNYQNRMILIIGGELKEYKIKRIS